MNKKAIKLRLYVFYAKTSFVPFIQPKGSRRNRCENNRQFPSREKNVACENDPLNSSNCLCGIHSVRFDVCSNTKLVRGWFWWTDSVNQIKAAAAKTEALRYGEVRWDEVRQANKWLTESPIKRVSLDWSLWFWWINTKSWRSTCVCYACAGMHGGRRVYEWAWAHSKYAVTCIQIMCCDMIALNYYYY